jgi:thiamine biosynthesis lipoprotein
MIKLEHIAELLGTQVRLVLVTEEEGRAREAMKAAFNECERIEQTFSRFVEGNELARLNARLGEWVTVSPELYSLISFGVELHDKTEGAFDMTVGSILEGLGYDADYSFEEKESGGLGKVELRDDLQIKITAPVDLGGLGKGHALDQMGKQLNEFENVLLDGGGDLIVSGHDENGKPWRVAFEHPTDPEQAIGVVDIQEPLALASSNPLKRKWKEHHHLIDPKTEESANDMLAVYVQAKTAMEADAYATALFVMGFEKAKEKLGQLSVQAMLIGAGGDLHRTEGFQGELFTA